jgi:prepilin-type N-terminal cleavage/methylation domain-containing protein
VASGEGRTAHGIMSPKSKVQSLKPAGRSRVEGRGSSEAEHGTRFHAFTLLELMIVVGIMGIILTMGVPIVYRMRHEAPLRKAVKDVVEVCSHARARAILQSKAVCVVFHPREGSFQVEGGGGTPASQNGSAGHIEISMPAPSTGSGLSGRLSERVAIEMLDVDLTEYKDADEVKVWFYPNGVCDELTLILRSLDAESDPIRAISLEVTTGLASVETDVNKLRSLKK